MKIIATMLLLIGLTSCAHEVVAPTASGLSGRWYSSHAINKTDYRLDDCLYLPDGTFTCAVDDHGCSGAFCEAESFTFAGTWAVQGTRLTRQCTTDFCSKSPKTWIIERLDRKTLLLSGGESWFRSKRKRDKNLAGAL